MSGVGNEVHAAVSADRSLADILRSFLSNNVQQELDSSLLAYYHRTVTETAKVAVQGMPEDSEDAMAEKRLACSAAEEQNESRMLASLAQDLMDLDLIDDPYYQKILGVLDTNQHNQPENFEAEERFATLQKSYNFLLEAIHNAREDQLEHLMLLRQVESRRLSEEGPVFVAVQDPPAIQRGSFAASIEQSRQKYVRYRQKLTELRHGSLVKINELLAYLEKSVEFPLLFTRLDQILDQLLVIVSAPSSPVVRENLSEMVPEDSGLSSGASSTEIPSVESQLKKISDELFYECCRVGLSTALKQKRKEFFRNAKNVEKARTLHFESDVTHILEIAAQYQKSCVASSREIAELLQAAMNLILPIDTQQQNLTGVLRAQDVLGDLSAIERQFEQMTLRHRLEQIRQEREKIHAFKLRDNLSIILERVKSLKIELFEKMSFFDAVLHLMQAITDSTLEIQAAVSEMLQPIQLDILGKPQLFLETVAALIQKTSPEIRSSLVDILIYVNQLEQDPDQKHQFLEQIKAILEDVRTVENQKKMIEYYFALYKLQNTLNATVDVGIKAHGRSVIALVEREAGLALSNRSISIINLTKACTAANEAILHPEQAGACAKLGADITRRHKGKLLGGVLMVLAGIAIIALGAALTVFSCGALAPLAAVGTFVGSNIIAAGVVGGVSCAAAVVGGGYMAWQAAKDPLRKEMEALDKAIRKAPVRSSTAVVLATPSVVSGISDHQQAAAAHS